jgi:1,4-dihydroxy-2-naphthoate octaprenyltransferase
MELLWPVSRADWVRDWFVMSASDLAIPIALIAAGVCGGWWFNLWPALPPANWLPLGVMFVGVALGIRATELWVRTCRRPTNTGAPLLAGMAGGAAFALGVAAWMLVGPTVSLDAWLRSLPRLWAVALGILLIAGAVTYTAHRRWLRWEVDT